MVNLRLLASLTALVFLLALSSVASAQQVPPHIFFGTATVNGLPAPAGVPVNAIIDGRLRGTSTVGSNSQYQIQVAQGSSTEITFCLGSLTADETATWQLGGATPNFNLTADSIYSLPCELQPGDPADIELEQPIGRLVGQPSHFFAHVFDVNGGPVSGIEVAFEVISGPNMGEVSSPNTGDCEPDDCATDTEGFVFFFYTGDGGAGIDTIVASFVDDNGVTQTSDPVEQRWKEQSGPPVHIVLVPPTQSKAVGQEVLVQAEVSDIDDVVVPGVEVTFEVMDGPNVGLVSEPNTGHCFPHDDCTTNIADGVVVFAYTGNGGPGTDTVVASFVDDDGVTQTADPVEVVWVEAGAPALISLHHDIGRLVGQTAHPFAQVSDINGFPVSGVEVTFQVVSGPNAGEVSSPNTGQCHPNDCTSDFEGHVLFIYLGDGGAGIDSIVASFVDDNGVTQTSDPVEQLWKEQAGPPVHIVLGPPTQTNAVGQEVQVNAEVFDVDIVGVPGVEVTFVVTDGPNAGEVSEPNTGHCFPNDDCTTNMEGGFVAFTYTGNGGPGTDTVVASFVDDNGVTQTAAPVEVVWTEGSVPATVTLVPTTSVNLVGQNHFIAATVTNSSGFPVANVEVTFEVTSGPNADEVSDPNTGECNPNDCTTGSDGIVVFNYPGDGGPGTDTIVASFVGNDGVTQTSDPAEKVWVSEPGPPVQITLIHTGPDTNPVGEDHQVFAIVRDSNSIGVPNVEVTFEVTNGPNAGEVSEPNTGECSPNNCATLSTGGLFFSYTGHSGPGTDTIVASFIDNDGVIRTSDPLEKVWEGEHHPGFPDAGTDNFLSIAVFEVMPVGGPNILTPLLLDFNTQVERSNPVNETDPAPETLENLCSSLTLPPGQECVDVLFPEGFGGVGRREVQTEIVSLSLEDRTGVGFGVMAGQPALEFFNGIGRPDLFTPSLGEVESLDLTGEGAPATDFPADSFFNVYAVVKTPLGPLFNKDPLMVVSRGITSFPPVAFYPHESMAEDPVLLYSVADPDGSPVAILKEAVHGTQAEELLGVPVDDPGFDDIAFGQLIDVIAPSGICGDQNGDEEVNIFDAIIDLQIIVGLTGASDDQMWLSDVLRDGKIDIFDVILLLQHIVGLTEITECGPLPTAG